MNADERTIAQVGERELIRLFSPYVQTGTSPYWSVGVGDDAAVASSKSMGTRQVITTDLLIENTHFLRNENTPWYRLGLKAASANISDIAAMGAWPTGLVVSVGLPGDVLVGDMLEFCRGLHTMSTINFHAPIIGGDTTRSESMVISITCFGEKKYSQADCLRSDARPGDYLYVTENLGSSRMGLELLLNNKTEPEFRLAVEDYKAATLQAFAPGLVSHHWQDEASIPELILSHHFATYPKVEIGWHLSEDHPRVAMLDISDGLYNEANLMAEASGVGIEIQIENIPVNPLTRFYCERRGIDPHEYALFSGEEYELLFAVPAKQDDIMLTGHDILENITCIGRITDGSGVRYTRNGKTVTPNNQTFHHF